MICWRGVTNKLKYLVGDTSKVYMLQNRPDGGLNPGSSVYETDALPLGHRAG